MKKGLLIDELRNYYFNEADLKSEDFRDHCYQLLNERAGTETDSFKLKELQYEVIAREVTPILFKNSPFYFETGTLAAISDGAWDLRGHEHVGAWLIKRNRRFFSEANPKAINLIGEQKKELLYLVCGHFCDEYQHFPFNYRPILQTGLKGVFEKAKERLERAMSDEERDYLNCTIKGLLCIKEISEKFADAAAEAKKTATDPQELKNYQRIEDSARYTPWNAPRNFYEALNMYAFLRVVMGTLEGVGNNSFGRVDVDLYPFYKKDIQTGVMTAEEAYDLVCDFLLLWDCRYDHDMKMVYYADHEFENTYVLGGCDKEGKPIYNEVTAMFLRATSEYKTIFPKIKCRFSANSPKEYLDCINADVIKGTSVVLYCNDEAIIPALIRAGKTVEEARDYIETGCWALSVPGVEKHDGGSYVNLLKVFEFSVHNYVERMKKIEIDFKSLDDAESFEEIYNITLENFQKLFLSRANLINGGRVVWSKVNPLPLYSSTLGDCIEKGRDYTAGGAKYNDDTVMCVGFPNVVDGLLAIKKLCFEDKKYSLAELLNAVRSNWEGYQDLRADVLKCPFWGDEQAETCAFASKFNNDIYDLLKDISTVWGGKTTMGHLTYTEIKWWGEQTKATPDGRMDGDYFSQGLTPSRLHYIPCVLSVLNTMKAMDYSTWASNTVINVILSSNKINLDACEEFLRAVAESHVQTLQLNCTTEEVLLDAQKHPEKYPDLIVRVCGFSARFTALSKGWQDEVLSRNFYE